MKKITFWKQLGIGIKNYIEALVFVFNKGLWVYFIYPIILSLLMFYVSFSLATFIAGEIETWIKNAIGFGSTEGWLSYLSGFLHFFIIIALKIIFFFVYSALSKYIILILMSPLLALLSERTEEILTGKKNPFSLAQFLKDVLRGIGIAFRNLIIQFSFILICFFVSWIPVLGWIAPFMLLIVSYYFYGFAFIDYCSERKKLPIGESVKYIRKHKGLAIGNGFIFSFLFAIPFVGVVLAPVLASVAASISVVEIDKSEYVKN